MVNRGKIVSVMSKAIKRLWIIWFMAAACVAAGTIAYRLSTNWLEVPLNLKAGTEVTVSLFRILPAKLHSDLIFKGGSERKELGVSHAKSDFRETGVLEYQNPGEPIKIKASFVDSGKEVLFEAEPASGFGSNFVIRDLVPFKEDGDSNKFAYMHESLPLNAGTTNLRITVLEVGDRLEGEEVTLRIAAPLGFKTYTPGYRLLWWFFLWPIYVTALLIFAAVLIWRGYVKRKHNPVSPPTRHPRT